MRLRAHTQLESLVKQEVINVEKGSYTDPQPEKELTQPIIIKEIKSYRLR
jgi:hypothetical protein